MTCVCFTSATTLVVFDRITCGSAHSETTTETEPEKADRRMGMPTEHVFTQNAGQLVNDMAAIPNRKNGDAARSITTPN